MTATRRLSLEACLRYANAAGSMNVTVPDGLTWNQGFDDLTQRIEGGWQTEPAEKPPAGWKLERSFLVGPANKGNWE